MENYIIHPKDLKKLEQKLKTTSKSKKISYIYTSFTYITPNYSVILFLEELQKFAKKHDLKVILVIWDMNVLADTYYRKMKRDMSDKAFIDQKIDEIYTIAYSIGFDQGDISIHKSSDLWKRFIVYKESEIYQEFYSTLMQIKVEEYAYGYKAAYMIQLPMNLFFCKYFHKLFPEDVGQEINLIFLKEQREKIYTQSRKAMYDLNITKYESPLFVIMNDIPYFNYRGYEPEWNMSYTEVLEIINGIKPNKIDTMKVLELLKSETEDIGTDTMHEKLARSIFNYLQEKKKNYVKIKGVEESRMLSINDKDKLMQIGSVLRSKIALNIILKADGTRTISKIAKELDKSIPTISTYIKKLKSAELIAVYDSNKIKRTIKGFKANFEFGLQ